MFWVERVLVDVSGGNPEDGYSSWGGHLLFEAVEMGVNRSGLPSGVGEDDVVNLGLDSGAEGYGAVLRGFGNVTILIYEARDACLAGRWGFQPRTGCDPAAGGRRGGLSVSGEVSR
ncbi:hypothetical protein ACFV1B_14885 [Streptomyces sp. NPDC059637]|uniref:hypothetical protein n=1 Tax=Streptomyces sp. NPDC059637 TaxID=3347752 RepID=UPI0036766D06